MKCNKCGIEYESIIDMELCLDCSNQRAADMDHINIYDYIRRKFRNPVEKLYYLELLVKRMGREGLNEEIESVELEFKTY